MHLATALLVNRALLRAGMPSLTLVASDEDLLAAGRGEGLATENPERHR